MKTWTSAPLPPGWHNTRYEPEAAVFGVHNDFLLTISSGKSVGDPNLEAAGARPGFCFPSFSGRSPIIASWGAPTNSACCICTCCQVPTQGWGSGTSKSVEDLLQEVRGKEAQLSVVDGAAIRAVEVLNIYVLDAAGRVSAAPNVLRPEAQSPEINHAAAAAAS